MFTRDSSGTERSSWAWHALGKSLRWAWNAFRLPTLAVVLLLEPLVCGLLSALAVLGALCALFFEFVVRIPHYPFWLMIGVSTGLAGLMIPYYLVVRLLSSPPR
jgi:hypothetical protein